MNERIRELAEQAGLHDFVFEAMGIGEEFEKFAELIVQECLDQIEAARFELPEPVIKHVRKHFGV